MEAVGNGGILHGEEGRDTHSTVVRGLGNRAPPPRVRNGVRELSALPPARGSLWGSPTRTTQGCAAPARSWALLQQDKGAWLWDEAPEAITQHFGGVPGCLALPQSHTWALEADEVVAC